MTNRLTNYVGIGAIVLATTLGGCASARPSQLERDVYYDSSDAQKTQESSTMYNVLENTGYFIKGCVSIVPLLPFWVIPLVL